MSVVPFVAISGYLLPDSGDFSLYTNVYVAALKYRPGTNQNITMFFGN